MKLWNQVQFDVNVHTEKRNSYYYGGLNTSMYRGNTVCFITHAIYSQDSFRNVKNWIGELERYTREGTPVVVIGFYKDLSDPNNIAKEKFLNVYPLPYFEFQINDPSEQDQFNFDKFILENVELYYNYYYKSNVFPLDEKQLSAINTSNKTTTTTASTSTTSTTTTTDNNDNDNINYLPIAYIKEFKTEQEQTNYESMFFRVFKNKLLFKYIFKQIHWIHKRYKIRAYNFYSLSFNKLIVERRFDLLKHRLAIQESATQETNNPLFMWDQFSYINVINFLRVNRDYKLFQTLYDQYKEQFDVDHNVLHYFVDQDMGSRLEQFPQILESAVVGGNLETVEFLANGNRGFHFTEECLEYAIAYGHMDIVKYLIKHKKVRILNETELLKFMKTARQYRQYKIEDYLDSKKVKSLVFNQASLTPSPPSFFQRLINKIT